VPKRPRTEEELHKLFLEKRSIGRKIDSRWLYRNARIIYGRIYPQGIVQIEGKQTSYTGFAFLLVG
jgi:hypothetical protein